MCTVVLPQALRGIAGGAHELAADGATVGAVLDALAEQHPALVRRIRDEQGELRRYVNVYVDGEDARQLGGTEAPVPPSAELLVLPSVAGG
jgi:molybdopterin converting factor small subunit